MQNQPETETTTTQETQDEEATFRFPCTDLEELQFQESLRRTVDETIEPPVPPSGRRERRRIISEESLTPPDTDPITNNLQDEFYEDFIAYIFNDRKISKEKLLRYDPVLRDIVRARLVELKEQTPDVRQAVVGQLLQRMPTSDYEALQADVREDHEMMAWLAERQMSVGISDQQVSKKQEP